MARTNEQRMIRNAISGVYDIQKQRIANGQRILQQILTKLNLPEEPMVPAKDASKEEKAAYRLLKKERDAAIIQFCERLGISNYLEGVEVDEDSNLEGPPDSLTVQEAMDMEEEEEKEEKEVGGKKKKVKITNFFKVIITDYKSITEYVTTNHTSLKKAIGEKGKGIISEEAEVEILDAYFMLVAAEKRLLKPVKRLVENHPVWNNFLCHVGGCGPLMAGVILSEFDISVARYVSSFWNYAGVGTLPEIDLRKNLRVSIEDPDTIIGAANEIADLFNWSRTEASDSAAMTLDHLRIVYALEGVGACFDLSRADGKIEKGKLVAALNSLRIQLEIDADDLILKDLRGVLDDLRRLLSDKGSDLFTIMKGEEIINPNYGMDTGRRKGQSRRAEHLVDKEYRAKDGTIKIKKSITYNPFLKTKLLGVLGGSFLKGKRSKDAYYHELYYNYKNRIMNDERHAGKTKAHIHFMANRYMIKYFLQDLFVAWCLTVDRVPPPPYHEEKLDMAPHSKTSPCLLPILKEKAPHLIVNNIDIR